MIWDLILNVERRGTTITQAFQASYTLNPECIKSLGKGLGGIYCDTTLSRSYLSSDYSS